MAMPQFSIMAGRATTTALDRVSAWWSQKAAVRQDAERLARLSWLDAPLVLKLHVNPAISGDPEIDWLHWAVTAFLPKDTSAICNIGCGDGGLERHLRSLGVTACLDGFDIADGALRIARSLAEKE